MQFTWPWFQVIEAVPSPKPHFQDVFRENGDFFDDLRGPLLQFGDLIDLLHELDDLTDFLNILDDLVDNLSKLNCLSIFLSELDDSINPSPESEGGTESFIRL